MLETLVGHMRHNQVSYIPRYVTRGVGQNVMVASLRLGAALRTVAPEEGGCPDLAILSEPPFDSYARDPYTGASLRVVAKSDRWLVIASREPTSVGRDGQPTRSQPAVVVECASPSGG